MKSLNKDQFIQILADKKGFTKGDARALIDGVIEIFEQLIKNDDGIFEENPKTGKKKSKILLNVRGFGKLSLQYIPERTITKGKYAGKILPEATRATLKLSENIRFAGDGTND
jgi:nucleoid DNA-binding protein